MNRPSPTMRLLLALLWCVVCTPARGIEREQPTIHAIAYNEGDWQPIGSLLTLGLVSPWASLPQSNGTVSDSDRSIINRSNDPVWFDSSDGTIRPIAKGRSIDVDDRHDSIAGPAPRTPPGWWSTFSKNLGGVLSWLFQGWPLLLTVCLVSLLLLISFLLYRYVLEPELKGKQLTNRKQIDHEKAKLQDLPFEVEQSMIGLFAQAERYRAAGDYSKAIVYLFSFALVEMDGARFIRLARGKTNRVYLRELKGHDNLRDFTLQLVLAFEYAFFGKHILSGESFERIWEQVPQFEAAIKQKAASTKSIESLTNAGKA